MRLERRKQLKVDEFTERYLIGNQPVVIADAMEGWDLAWNGESLSRELGNYLVPVYDDSFRFIDIMRLGDFVERNFGRAQDPGCDTVLPYVRWYTRVRDGDLPWADDAFRVFAKRWKMPYFLPKTNYLLPCSGDKPVDPTVDLFPGKALFISGGWGSNAPPSRPLG